MFPSHPSFPSFVDAHNNTHTHTHTAQDSPVLFVVEWSSAAPLVLPSVAPAAVQTDTPPTAAAGCQAVSPACAAEAQTDAVSLTDRGVDPADPEVGHAVCQTHNPTEERGVTAVESVASRGAQCDAWEPSLASSGGVPSGRPVACQTLPMEPVVVERVVEVAVEVPYAVEVPVDRPSDSLAPFLSAPPPSDAPPDMRSVGCCAQSHAAAETRSVGCNPPSAVDTRSVGCAAATRSVAASSAGGRVPTSASVAPATPSEASLPFDVACAEVSARPTPLSSLRPDSERPQPLSSQPQPQTPCDSPAPSLPQPPQPQPQSHVRHHHHHHTLHTRPALESPPSHAAALQSPYRVMDSPPPLPQQQPLLPQATGLTSPWRLREAPVATRPPLESPLREAPLQRSVRFADELAAMRALAAHAEACPPLPPSPAAAAAAAAAGCLLLPGEGHGGIQSPLRSEVEYLPPVYTAGGLQSPERTAREAPAPHLHAPPARQPTQSPVRMRGASSPLPHDAEAAGVLASTPLFARDAPPPLPQPHPRQVPPPPPPPPPGGAVCARLSPYRHRREFSPSLAPAPPVEVSAAAAARSPLLSAAALGQHVSLTRLQTVSEADTAHGGYTEASVSEARTRVPSPGGGPGDDQLRYGGHATPLSNYAAAAGGGVFRSETPASLSAASCLSDSKEWLLGGGGGGEEDAAGSSWWAAKREQNERTLQRMAVLSQESSVLRTTMRELGNSLAGVSSAGSAAAAAAAAEQQQQRLPCLPSPLGNPLAGLTWDRKLSRGVLIASDDREATVAGASPGGHILIGASSVSPEAGGRGSWSVVVTLEAAANRDVLVGLTAKGAGGGPTYFVRGDGCKIGDDGDGVQRGARYSAPLPQGTSLVTCDLDRVSRTVAFSVYPDEAKVAFTIPDHVCVPLYPMVVLGGPSDSAMLK